MAKSRNPRNPTKEKSKENHQQHHQKPDKQHSWAVMRSLFTCKHLQTQIRQQQPQVPHHQPREQSKKQQGERQQDNKQRADEISKKCKKMKYCSGSLCSNTKVMHRAELQQPSSFSSSSLPEDQKRKVSPMGWCINNNDVSSRSIKAPLSESSGAIVPTSSSSSSSNSASLTTFATSSNSPSSISGSFRGMPFRRLSGCYECRMVVDPVLAFTRDPSLRTTICTCPDCGEIFMKAESLDLHHITRHAVAELGPEDTSKNIVEIIFQSSWLKKQSPVCKIERILKIQNTARTISRFEEYRDSIKARANKLPKRNPRCVADGNELLRFHCATFVCSLGLNGSSNLCNSVPGCNVCSIIKNGFKAHVGKGILTTATSGRAHDRTAGAEEEVDGKRAMLVCRVIAGRVKKNTEGNNNNKNNIITEDYDSVAGAAGVYSNLDELYVFNSKAILPCFVVIYGGF